MAETSVPIHELMANRWSPRAFDPDAKVTSEQLQAMLEAARWAPSFGNTQPARFLVGTRGDDTYRRIFGTLTTRNQSWTQRAGALLVALAITRNEKGEIPYAEYGVGLAGENLALQAEAEGLHVHQMAGFDPDGVRREFTLPEEVRPIVAIAVGVLGPAELLTDERDLARETGPRNRVPLAEYAFTGDWGQPAF